MRACCAGAKRTAQAHGGLLSRPDGVHVSRECGVQRRRRRCGLSLEVLCERCVVHGTARCGGSRCGSRGAAPRRPVRQKWPCEEAHGSCRRGTGEWVLQRAAAGAGGRSMCSSCCAAAARVPVPSDACAACADANERAARGSQGVARALGTGRSGGGGPLAKVQQHRRSRARVGPRRLGRTEPLRGEP